MDFDLPLNVSGIAEGFGVHGKKVEASNDLRPALEEAFSLGKPAVGGCGDRWLPEAQPLGFLTSGVTGIRCKIKGRPNSLPLAFESFG